MLTNILLSAILQSQKKEYDPFMALGRMRSEFGERAVSDNANSIEKWTWNARDMIHEGGTVMLFPDGAYDRRVYFQSFYEDPDEPGGPVDTVYWLAYETRSHQQINGEHISFNWKIKLEPNKKGETTPSGLGTLELMLRREGLAVPKQIPKEAEYTLKARKGFAAYDIAPGPGFSIFRYWYVNPDGESTKGTFYEPPWPQYDSDWGFPQTPFPYPVTDEEKAALTKQGWKFRLPLEKAAAEAENQMEALFDAFKAWEGGQQSDLTVRRVFSRVLELSRHEDVTIMNAYKSIETRRREVADIYRYAQDALIVFSNCVYDDSHEKNLKKTDVSAIPYRFDDLFKLRDGRLTFTGGPTTGIRFGNVRGFEDYWPLLSKTLRRRSPAEIERLVKSLMPERQH